MKFYDTVKINLHSGKGGNGIVAARREAKVAYGWPAGGNGGHGGDIIFIGNDDENTLQKYLFHHDYKATDGEPGRTKEQYGADGDDLELTVPLGTIIRDQESGLVLHQITQDGERWTALQGGAGGIGNMHFATSTHQYPEYALLGEPGRTAHVILELQLLADVALIGTPSVGKSTLINASSNAKAKVAAYHFTTLVPNLGMVTRHGQDFSMIDIPGLIEGAADGKGLGNAFLRHILKAYIRNFVHDLSQYETGMDDGTKLLSEIEQFITTKYENQNDREQELDHISYEVKIVDRHIHMLVWAHFVGEKETTKHLLLDKMLLWVLNKYDLVADDEIITEYKHAMFAHVIGYFKEYFDIQLTEKLLEHNTFVVSGATHHGTDAWLSKMSERLQSHEFVNEFHLDLIESEEVVINNTIIDITDEKLPQLIEEGYVEEGDSRFLRVWSVSHPDVIRAVYITMRGKEDGEQRFWEYLKKLGFLDQAEEAGIRYGDIIVINPGNYRDAEERFVQWMR